MAGRSQTARAGEQSVAGSGVAAHSSVLCTLTAYTSQAATLPAAFYTTDKVRAYYDSCKLSSDMVYDLIDDLNGPEQAHTIERQTVFRRSWQVQVAQLNCQPSKGLGALR